MIQLYSGTPGSGKSLHLAKDILRRCNGSRKCRVLCNFNVNTKMLKYPDRFFYLPNHDLSVPLITEACRDFFQREKLPLQEDRIYLYIDEAQVLFNSRRWQDAGRMEWLEFFSQHRKFGLSVVLVAQFDQMLDKQIRSLIEYEVVHRKLSNFGTGGFLFRLLAFGDVFIAVERWYSLSQKIGSYWFRDSKKLHSLYDTFNAFDSKSDFLLE